MKKHAYLILAHGNIDSLTRLLRALDDSRNDIYIHYDAKSELTETSKDTLCNCISNSTVTFVDRVSVSWGGYSIVAAQLNLIKAAIHMNYEYYHFLSGADYPIKSQDYIHSFFEKHTGQEFIEFWNRDNYLFRVKYYYSYQEKIGTYSYDFKTLFYRVLSKFNLCLQKLRGINRLKAYDGEWKIGSNWASFTHEFASYLLSQEKEIFRLFHDGLAVDEMYLQTMLWNSNFKINNCPDKTRYIKWYDSKPYVWTTDDIDKLMSSDCLFARKIVSAELTDLIDLRLSQNHQTN